MTNMFRDVAGVRTGRIAQLLAEVRGNVRTDVASTVVGNVVGAIAAFAAGAVLARWLGPALRGVFEFGLFIANSGVLLFSLGLNIPVSVFLSRDPATSIWSYRFGLWWLGGLLVLGSALVVMTGGVVPAVSLGPSFRGIASGTLVVFGSLFLTQLANAVLIGLGRIQRLNVGVIVRWSVYFVGVLSLSLTARPDVEIALAWYATAALASVFVTWGGFRDLSRSAEVARTSVAARRAAVWYGIRGQLGNLLQFASYRFDVLIVGLWVGTTGLGVYSVGVMFAEALWLLPNAVGTVLLSHTSRSATDVSDQRIRIVFPLAMGAVLLAASLVSVMAPIVASLYLGPAYAKVPIVTWLLIPGAVALSGSKVLANELTARGFPGVNTMVAACGAVATIAGDVLLIPPYGILGASIASSIGYTLTFALMFLAFCRRTGIWPFWFWQET
jgi:O-antigen/teichoic acid export membrane protein